MISDAVGNGKALDRRKTDFRSRLERRRIISLEMDIHAYTAAGPLHRGIRERRERVGWKEAWMEEQNR